MTITLIVIIALVGAALTRSEFAQRIMFRLWLVGSGCWALIWLTLMAGNESLGLRAAFLNAVMPPLAVFLAVCVLGWVFQRVR